MKFRTEKDRADYYEAKLREEQKNYQVEKKKLVKDINQKDEQIKMLQDQLDQCDVENELLTKQKRELNGIHMAEVDELNAQITMLEKQIELLTKEVDNAKRTAIRNVAHSKSSSMINDVTLEMFRRGDLYYDATIFNISNHCNPKSEADEILDAGKVNPQPIFSVEDLIIRINPKTGMELEPDEISYIKSLIQDEPEYDIALMELSDYNCFHSGEELVEWAYAKGLQLLDLYIEKVF